MKKNFTTLFLTLAICLLSAFSVQAASAQSLALDETNFPDPILRQALSRSADKDGDGTLTEEEIDGLTNLSVAIDAEAYVEDGKTFSKEDALLFYCDDSIPDESDFNIDPLESPDVDFTGLEHFKNLKRLFLYWVNPVNLHLEQLSNLKEGLFYYIPGDSLDLSKNTKLKEVYLFGTAYKTVDLTGLKKLEEFFAQSSELSSLDISTNANLNILYLCNNQLTKLDISNNSKLKKVDISLNPFEKLDKTTLITSSKTNIERLWATDMENCKSVDVSYIPTLKYLYLGASGHEEIGVKSSGVKKVKIGANLIYLSLFASDQLTKLNSKTLQAPADGKLQYLVANDCDNLISWNTNHLPALKEIDFRGDHYIKTMNLAQNTKLKKIKSDHTVTEAARTVTVSPYLSKSCMNALKKAIKNSAGKTVGKIVYDPGTVTGLKAIKKTKTTLKLTWAGVDGASGYKIYDAETGKRLATVSAQTGQRKDGSVCKTLTGLKAGQTRKYKVRAFKTVNGVKYYGAYSKVYTKATAK